MFPFRGSKKSTKKAPKWLMWLLLGFMVYSIISTLLMDDLPLTKAPTSQEQEELSLFRFSFVEDGLISRRLDYFSSDMVKGRGAKVQCWSEAEVQYKLYTPSGEVVKDMFASGEVKRLRIGGGEVLPGLERGILDMNAGGRRAISIRKELAFAHHDFFSDDYARHPVGAIVEVKAVHPLETKWSHTDRLKIMTEQRGTGLPLECGQLASVELKITNARGDVLFASTKERPLLVIPGSGKQPFALEKGVLGMRSGETRIVVAPQEYVFTEESSRDGRVWLEGASLPADEAWIIEIMAAEAHYPSQ